MKKNVIILLLILSCFSVKSQLHVALDHSGKYAFTGYTEIIMWDLNTHKKVNAVKCKKISNMSVSKDDKYLAISGDSTMIFALPEMKLVKIIYKNTTYVEFSNFSDKLIMVTNDDNVELLDIVNNKLLFKFVYSISHWGDLLIAASPDGKKLLVGCEYNSQIYCLDLLTGQTIGEFKYRGEFICIKNMCFSPDSKFISVTSRCFTTIYDANKYSKLHKFSDNPWGMASSSIYADEGIYYNYWGRIEIRNVNTGELITELYNPNTSSYQFAYEGENISEMKLSSDNRYLLCGKEKYLWAILFDLTKKEKFELNHGGEKKLDYNALFNERYNADSKWIKYEDSVATDLLERTKLEYVPCHACEGDGVSFHESTTSFVTDGITTFKVSTPGYLEKCIDCNGTGRVFKKDKKK